MLSDNYLDLPVYRPISENMLYEIAKNYQPNMWDSLDEQTINTQRKLDNIVEKISEREMTLLPRIKASASGWIHLYDLLLRQAPIYTTPNPRIDRVPELPR